MVEVLTKLTTVRVHKNNEIISIYFPGLQGVSGVVGLTGGYVIKSANYTLTGNDFTVECITNASIQTLPSAVSLAGKQFRIINATALNITVATTSSQTIGNLPSGNPTTITLAPQEWLDVISNGTNYRII